MVNVGEKVILAGLILQFVSYGFFCALLVKSHISIKSSGGSPTYETCKVLIWALYISSALISVRPPSFRPRSLSLNVKPPCRSVLSIVSSNFLREAIVTSLLTKASRQTNVFSVLRQLTVNLVFLYALDALPLLLAIAVYIPWWPTKYIKYDKSEGLQMGTAYLP